MYFNNLKEIDAIQRQKIMFVEKKLSNSVKMPIFS